MQTAATIRRTTQRRAWLDAYKLERGCVDCGYREHPAALGFDHVDPATKRWEISSNFMRCWPDVLAEIARCEVRCQNCHAIRSAAQALYRVGRPRGPRFLEAGRWSQRHPRCRDCRRTDRRHCGRGFCSACYERRRVAGTLAS